MSKTELDDWWDIATKGTAEKAKEFLANKTFEINVKDEDGRTALHRACIAGNLEVIDVLLANKANVNIAEEQKGQTPLHFAVIFNHAEVVKKLLEAGADKSVADKKSRTPLQKCQQLEKDYVADEDCSEEEKAELQIAKKHWDEICSLLK